MKINDLLEELKLVYDKMSLENNTLSDNAARKEIAEKALKRIGLSYDTTHFNLDHKQINELIDYLYWMGYEDGVNSAEYEE